MAETPKIQHEKDIKNVSSQSQNETYGILNQVETLEAENAALKERLAVLEAKPHVKEGHELVFIKSENVAYTKKPDGKYVTVSIDGTQDDGTPFSLRYDVICDQPVEVPHAVAEVLKSVIERQKDTK